MSPKIFFVFAALCFAQVALSEKAAEPIQLEALVTKAQKALTEMSAEVLKSMGINESPNAQEVAKTLMDQSQVLAGKVGAMVSDLQKEISAHPDINSVASAVAKRLNQTVQDLQKQAPAMQAKASEIQTQLKSGMETLVAESQKLVNAFSGELNTVQTDINKITKTALDQVIDVAAKIQETVKGQLELPKANV